jgi:Carbonic anhydrase
MNRRTFFRGAVGVLACPLCAGLLGRTATAADAAHHWTYEGAEGPDAWGKIDPTYAACSTGTQQSPVDLSGAVVAEINAGDIGWQPIGDAVILNNGHTIQVNTPGAGGLTLDGAEYTLAQFHFHHMSEHTVNGTRFPMEAHFVHKAANGGSLAVVGVFIIEGADNAALKPIWATMPAQTGEKPLAGLLNAKDLLPGSTGAYRYEGSLTTPPCSEIVNWVVMREPIAASTAQIAAFAKLFPDNARPVQALNRRFILSTE